MTYVSDLQARVERIRTASAQSSEYWSVRTDGKTIYVYLNPPGDIVRLRKHYPGCNAEPMTKAAWMAAS